jgi:hypothetical protein
MFPLKNELHRNFVCQLIFNLINMRNSGGNTVSNYLRVSEELPFVRLICSKKSLPLEIQQRLNSQLVSTTKSSQRFDLLPVRTFRFHLCDLLPESLV